MYIYVSEIWVSNMLRKMIMKTWKLREKLEKLHNYKILQKFSKKIVEFNGYHMSQTVHTNFCVNLTQYGYVKWWYNTT